MNTVSARTEWVKALAEATLPFRELRAEESKDRAAAAINQRDESGYRWHSARARGQLERFERIGKCGTEAWPCKCSSCGHESHRVPVRCSCHRVCLPCRQRRAAHERDRFRAGRHAALGRLRPLTTRGVGGNRFREVFVTLTVPHAASTAEDIAALYDAWTRFRSRLNYYLKHRLRLPRRWAEVIPYVRVTEIGTGNEGGHVHFHFWAILPFLHHAQLRRWWGEALRDVTYVPVRSVDELLNDATEEWDRRGIVRAALPRHDARTMRAYVPWPVLDVRSAHDVAGELVKYLVKDLVDGETLVGPWEFADWYCALEGRRLLTASLRFWIAVEVACQKCGTIGQLRVIVPKQECSTDATPIRGPPRTGVPSFLQ